MCRSATSALNLRPQCGHCLRSSCVVAGGGPRVEMSMPACSGRLRAWHAECVWCVWVCGCVGSGRQIGGRGIAVGVCVGGCGCGCGREAGGGEGRMHGRGARLLRAQQLSVVRHRRAELLRLLEGVALVSPRVCVPVGRLHLRARANARHGVAWRALPAMASRVTLGRPTQGRIQIQARSQASAGQPRPNRAATAESGPNGPCVSSVAPPPRSPRGRCP